MKPGMPIAPKDWARTPGYQAYQLRLLAQADTPVVIRNERLPQRETGIDWWLPRAAFGGVLACLVVLGLLWICGGGR